MTRASHHVFVAMTVAASLAGPLHATSADPAIGTVATLQRGTAVILVGTVDSITDEDEFVFRDETGTVPVYVGPNQVPVAEGEQITLHGGVDDDRPLEVYATEIIRADGTVVALPNDY